jgi:general secretion pathway protein A
MYLGFFGLKEKAFSSTPDPKFLFLTPSHREALAQLVYGVREQRGFMVLTGEVGTGKTTLLRALVQRLDSTTSVAYLAHAALPFEGLLEYLLEDFGIAKGEQSQAQRLVTLNHFLIEQRRSGRGSVLIIDEAQNIDAQTLEQVRLLSNFETSTEKLLQIVLAGQPELSEKLNLPELRQLKQRIGLRCRIARLMPEETRQYIRTRLRIAGANDLTIFGDDAVRRIAAYTGGIPRLVNIVCDHCLVIGYAEQKRRIDGRIAEEAVRYMDDDSPSPRRRMRRASPGWADSLGRLAVGLVAGGLLGLGIAGFGSEALGDWPYQAASFMTHVWQSLRGLVGG